MALGVQLPDQQERRAEVEEAPEDQADQLGLGRVHHQLAVPDVVAERRVAAHEDALAAAGGELVPDPFAGELALELREREQDVERQPPIEVVVQNDCVTETKVTLFRSNTSTSLAKSVSERDSRSIL